jgi:hypothetical protein
MMKYGTITVYIHSLDRFMTHTKARLPDAANGAFNQPLTQGEILYSIKQGKEKKSPGLDGISHDFYLTFWEEIKGEMVQILNEMYINKLIHAQQKRASS